MTPRQQEILDTIRRLHRQHGPPSIVDVADALGITSTGQLSDDLAALTTAGLIRRGQGLSRGGGLPDIRLLIPTDPQET